MTAMLSDGERINEIAFYCNAIERALKDCCKAEGKCIDFKETRDFDACAFYIGLIGEHVNKLTNEFKANIASVPWRSIIGLRNRIFHDYMSVNKSRLLEVMQKSVPELNDRCRTILSELDPCAKE